MERQGKAVEITDRALDLLTEKGFSQAYGARFLKRHIDEKVKLPLTAMWKDASHFTVDAKTAKSASRRRAKKSQSSAKLACTARLES
jgi:ATP-dependent Clp protease ATP-binding subunit ClpA